MNEILYVHTIYAMNVSEKKRANKLRYRHEK